MRPLALPGSLIAALCGASAFAAPPSQPGDLRVDVYSATAAELFWNRSSDPEGPVLGYEVRRDGEVLGTFDALSYFSDALNEGRAYTYTVTAINVDGERSTPASIDVVGGRDDSAAASDNTPPMPANLRATVYSSTAGELFWDRVTDAALEYEVSTDGEVVASTNGTSAFIADRPDLDGARFEVVAIGVDGARSSASVTTFGGGVDGTPDPDVGPGGDGAQPNGNDASLAAPTALEATVFSLRDVELGWQPGDGTSRFEILRNGRVLGTTEGRSWFDNSHRRGITYAYAVRAIDGSRTSPAATTVLRTDGGEPAPLVAALPPVPSPLAVDRLSTTAGLDGEIALDWSASVDPVDDRSPRYQIKRNERVLATVEGTSFIDRDAPVQVALRYEVTPVAADGVRTGQPAVTVRSPGPDARLDPSDALPGDCLRARGEALSYCYSPSTGELQAVFDDGAPFWRFALPAGGDRNIVRALASDGDRLRLVAATGGGDLQRLEVSTFRDDGAFLFTRALPDTTIGRDDPTVVATTPGGVYVTTPRADGGSRLRLYDTPFGLTVAEHTLSFGVTELIVDGGVLQVIGSAGGTIFLDATSLGGPGTPATEPGPLTRETIRARAEALLEGEAIERAIRLAEVPTGGAPIDFLPGIGTVFRCPDGGRFTVPDRDDEPVLDPERRLRRFQACRAGGVELNGTVEISRSFSDFRLGSAGSTEERLENLRVRDEADRELAVTGARNGSYLSAFGNTCGGPDRRSRSIDVQALSYPLLDARVSASPYRSSGSTEEDDVLFPNDADSGFTCGTRTTRSAEASIDITTDGVPWSIDRRYASTIERSTGLVVVDTVEASYTLGITTADGAGLDARLDPNDAGIEIETLLTASGQMSVVRRPFELPVP